MIKKLERKLKRLQSRLESYDLDKPSERYNYFGGWSVGYIQGQISMLEDLLDDIQDGDISLVEIPKQSNETPSTSQIPLSNNTPEIVQDDAVYSGELPIIKDREPKPDGMVSEEF